MIFNCVNETVLQNAKRHLETEGLGKEVKFSPIRKSRNQESYFHTCVKIISDYTGDSPEDIKMRIKYSVLPLREIKANNGQVYLYPESTITQPKETYSKLIEAVLMTGAMLNLKMPDPQFYGMAHD